MAMSGLDKVSLPYRAGGVFLGILLLTACGHVDAEDQGQVIATVGGEELTVPMLESALTASSGVDPRNKQVQRNTSERLIDQMGLEAEAKRAGLDRSPSVSRQIKAAEREILATAYLESLTDRAKPPSWQVTDFFEAHPFLFAERKKYRLTMLAVAGATSNWQAAIGEFTRGAKPIELIADQLANRGADAMVRHFTATSDSLPEAVARSLKGAKIGSRVSYNIDNVQYLVEVDQVEESPLQLSEARDMIERRIMDDAYRQAVQEQLKAFRTNGTVVYASYGKSALGLTEKRPNETQ
jgi:EpsD family peptidyl-prolyl cis-trans isomerase